VIDWLIFIEHKTNVYVLVTIDFNIIRGTGKKHEKIQTLVQNQAQRIAELHIEVEKILRHTVNRIVFSVKISENIINLS